jgi:redox-sensing transcriptional repressor
MKRCDKKILSADISEKTIERLSLYRRVLNTLRDQGKEFVCSHELAEKCQGSSAQVRRDFMTLGCVGRRSRGYNVNELIGCIGAFLDAPSGETVALVGVGNLGRALLDYLVGRRPNLAIKAAFDTDPRKFNRTFSGCPCYPMQSLEEVVLFHHIHTAIIAVPAAHAQEVAGQLCAVGIRGLLNFAPVRLDVPEDVFVEDMDISAALEKTAYFARARACAGPPPPAESPTRN